MKAELIQTFMMQNAECFDQMQLQDIQSQLASVPDEKAALVLSAGYQKPTVILIIAILLGWERFFLDDIALGVVKILTGYGCGIWWLIDIFSAKKRTTEYNYKKFSEALLMSK